MRASASMLLLTVLTTSANASAQGTPVDPTTSPAKDADTDEEAEEETPAKPGATSPSPEPVRKDGFLPLPPPGDPRIDEQTPAPYLEAVPRTSHQRHVEIGPDVGVWSRPAKGSGVSYSPGLSYGVHARVDLLRFLGFRVYANQASHQVDVPRGALGLADTQVDQPDLEVFELGARLEPTFMPLPTLRLWAGIGMAWGRATAPEPTSSGAIEIDHQDRSGVFLEYAGALGATWDLVPNWLALTASFSGGVVKDQSGDLFHDQQASNRNDGTLTRIGALPEFESSFSALLGVGIIL